MPSGETDATICSKALALIGEDSIADLATDTTNRSEACNQIYPMVRKAALARYPWRFSMKQQQLSIDAGAVPIKRWTHAYILPTDRLQNSAYRLYGSDVIGTLPLLTGWEYIDTHIYTDEADLWIDYYADLSGGEADWPYYFIEFVIYDLAAKLAFRIIKDAPLAREFRLIAVGADGGSGLLQEARFQDAVNLPVRTVGDDTLTRARFGGAFSGSGFFT